ncbi:hypothetical protein VP01_227g7 [Puccinia sorghi]|uniref:Uncharacterized protein n=1 Tax=Puccinia sorghi TaxID=27349 RepID=A0A0L6VA13_9BASI|nr:hypothetical protein VP01_227g7 [Puccinia sorghi]
MKDVRFKYRLLIGFMLMTKCKAPDDIHINSASISQEFSTDAREQIPASLRDHKSTHINLSTGKVPYACSKRTLASSLQPITPAQTNENIGEKRIKLMGVYMQRNVRATMFDRTAQPLKFGPAFCVALKCIVPNRQCSHLISERGESKMSEDQFAEMLKWPIANSGPYRSDEQPWQQISLVAVETLIQNRRVWFTHWKSQIQTNLSRINFWCQESQDIKPKSFAKLVIQFLFYVEMINTIVPDLRGVGFHLAEALALIQEDVNTGKTNGNIKHHNVITNIKAQLMVGQVDALPPALWTLLEFWMFKLRRNLYEKICTVDPRGLLRTKFLFNIIFTQSIENLSKIISRE